MSEVHCCRNCFHESRGFCLRTSSTNGEPGDKRSLAYVSDGDPGWLHVAPNFCCVQHYYVPRADDAHTCQREHPVL